MPCAQVVANMTAHEPTGLDLISDVDTCVMLLVVSPDTRSRYTDVPDDILVRYCLMYDIYGQFINYFIACIGETADVDPSSVGEMVMTSCLAV